MGTNIDLLIRMLNKEGYKYSFVVDEIEIELNNSVVFIKDDVTAYEITYKNNNDVAHDETEVLNIIENYK
ncbi:hypothetical protein [Staphylococcus hominis]|uniref:hypothetical protein n=1 Tax=Staphylococcus hominis TaxID=1290 RepID=UPI00143E8B92|nr:hypothetical protein [Staphylococcus hominis]QIY35984.1 hypothetical protein FOC53_00125 [Staphylococcus hominis]QIY36037.1 hypothetical protein FOC53_00415 [Staphylococcus hominis]